jgi:hypothetical protein
MTNWVKNLVHSGKKFTSQGNQDGILKSIFQNVPYVNNPPVCIEFGYNSKELVDNSSSGPNIGQLVLAGGFK